MTNNNALAATLLAAGPFVGYRDKANLYGFLIGSWTYRALTRMQSGEFAEATGDMQCGWILHGRAIQEVWNLPGFFYGTILRFYDPEIDAWHIFWNEPVDQYYTHLIGRASGNDIVQFGKNKLGQDVRWSFRDITAESFRWIGEEKAADGAWLLHRDMRVRRARQ